MKVNPIRIRAAELAKAIADACQTGHPSSTRVGIREGDWEIICLGLGILACTDDEELKAEH